VRRSGIVIAALVVTLGAAATFWWRSARGPTATRDRAPAPGRSGAAGRTLDPDSYVRARAAFSNSTDLGELVQAYDEWVSRPDALDARRAIVRALVGREPLAVGLESLLAAVDADRTPRQRDPLWGDLVAAVAERWDASTLPYGRDLVHIEARPKPRDLVLESLAHARLERLAPEQRPLLASDFIDLYATLAPDQKPAFTAALGSLAGNDVVEILAGRGLTEGSTRLKVASEREQALEHVRRNPVQEAPPEE